MDKNYKPIKSMKEVPEQLRKLRRQYLRYQQAEIIYSISHKKLFELASDAGAIYRIDGTVLINRDIFDDYLERFHEPATGKGKEKKMSGNVWMFSDEIDDEDLEFMSHDYVTYNMACEYYRLGIKPVVRMAHEAGAVYKIGKKVLIRRSIFEAYLREKRKI